MLVCVTADGSDINSNLDPRFGRCAYFLFINPDDLSCEAMKNEAAELSGGAGVQAAQAALGKNPDVILTGRVGPKAMDVLEAANTKLLLGLSGSVKEVVDRYKNGAIESAGPAQSPYKQGAILNAGLAQSAGRGQGRGRGSGRGGGRGLGRRQCARPQKGLITKEEELAWLREDTRILEGEIQAIKARIRELEST